MRITNTFEYTSFNIIIVLLCIFAFIIPIVLISILMLIINFKILSSELKIERIQIERIYSLNYLNKDLAIVTILKLLNFFHLFY